MLAPNQTLLLHDYFTRSRDLWLLCEQYDCDHDQMIAIIGAITPHLPGKGLDYSAILSNDPIACDHLVLHCQRSIGQLDSLYDRLISLFDSSSSHELQINKRTTVNTPPDWAKPSFSDNTFRWDTSKGSEKVETTTLENKQRFRILESAMKCLERGLKMQITLTQRKEKLSKEKLSKGSLNKETPSKENLQNRNLRAQQDHTPFSGMPGLSGMQAYKGMTGYELDQLQSESTSPESSAPLASLRETIPPVPPQETNFNPPGSPGWLYPTTGAAQPQEASNKSRSPTNNLAHAENPREEDPVTHESSASLASLREKIPLISASEPGSPGWLYPTTRAARPQEPSNENRHSGNNHANNMAHAENPREEEPVNVFEFSALSVPPCEPSPPDSASEPGSPGWLYPTTRAATPQEPSNESRHPANSHANKMAYAGNPTEEEPVNVFEFSVLSVPPCEPSPPVPLQETNSNPDPFAKFGPPKEFAYPPHIAELMPNRYPWRKELKEKQANRNSKSQPLQTSAPPREASFTSPPEEKPSYHQRE